MEKIDLKKQLKDLYGTKSRDNFVIIDVPKMNFLMVDGQGDPNFVEAYKEAIEALYAVSYRIKFAIKNGVLAINYGVMPLESLWWTDNPADFSQENKDIWRWRAMIMQPKWVDIDIYKNAIEETAKKKKLAALSKIQFAPFEEGKSAQCLYIGPYSDEQATIQKLHNFISKSGHKLHGKHHEIYLSDARRTHPSKLKTIIRQPFY